MDEKLEQQEIAELKQKIARLEETVRELQSLSVIGELAGTTAHEFNNILTLTINYAKMGLRHEDEETRTKAFTKILDASNRAAKIVGVVLGMARNRKQGKEPTDLTALVDDVLMLLEKEMNKYRITVERKFDAIPLVQINANQIQQALINLLVNARQASSQGSRIVVVLRKSKSKGFVEVVIRDYGVGIPKESLPQIFDAFYSTKSGPDETGKGGSGLGLAMCKRIIEEHKGKIRVDSTPGKGTAFTLKLPIAEQNEE
ncbi:MAG: ATP-binding protein [Planctomycetia bacterium]|nr:ATP-binding protein [Planctomycetia bacterium]